MTKPEIGAVFDNPRGRSYEVIGHMLDSARVVVRDRSTGFCDTAIWSLMTRENGWRRTNGRVYHLDYGTPGIDVVSTPVQMHTTDHVEKMMTAALEGKPAATDTTGDAPGEKR